MRSNPLTVAAAWLFACACSAFAQAQTADPRLKEVWYDAQAVITVPVKRGVVTHVALDRGEAVEREVAPVPGEQHDREIRHDALPAALSGAGNARSVPSPRNAFASPRSAGSAAATTRSCVSRVMQRWSVGQLRW